VDAHVCLEGAARVIGSGSRLIAVQTAVVGVLLVVVFATLLQPESETPISGVEAPSEPSRPQPPGPDIYTGPNEEPSEPREPNPPSTPSTPSTPQIPPAPQNPAPEPAPEAPAEPAPVPDGDGGERPGGQGSPSDDQYADALTRLFTRMN
jgi:hypothetical protein